MQIPDEKARAWTRPEDYWPPRRLRRSGRSAPRRFVPTEQEEQEPETRPLLDLVPYAALLLALAVLAVAIIAMAWPGRTVPQQAAPAREPVEVGLAPKGWIDEAQPTRR